MIRRSEEELKTEEVARSHIMKRIKSCPYLVVTADIVAPSSLPTLPRRQRRWKWPVRRL